MRVRRLPRVLVAIAGASVLTWACGSTVGPSEALPSIPDHDPSAPAPSISAAPSDFVSDAARGPWRRIPVDVSPFFSSNIDATCRAAEPAIGDIRTSLVDVRGEGRITVVFADDTIGPAFECRARVDSKTVADVEVVPLQAPDARIADDAIDAIRYEVVTDDVGSRTVLIGRVGRSSFDVIAGFDDETFVWGTKGGGWYAMWWPGTGKAAQVTSVDSRNFVIGGYDLPD